MNDKTDEELKIALQALKKIADRKNEFGENMTSVCMANIARSALMKITFNKY